MKKQSSISSKGIINQFRQQLFKAWQPVPTLNKTIIIFAVLGSVFVTVGVLLQVFGSRITEYSIDYNNCQINTNCTYNITITNKLIAPVFLFYELNGFYQNHRLYIDSTSINQLKGDILTVDEINDYCTPIVKNSDLFKKTSITGTDLDQDGPANPCGLIAYSMFNDSYILSNSNGQIDVSSQGIAWQSDKNLYKITEPDQMWLNTTDERFMVWMRVAALPSFRKIWGRINTDIEQGTYTINVTSLYDVKQFDASKKLVLAQSNLFGSKDVIMSISYLTVGGACIVFGITFSIVKIKKILNARKQRLE